MVQRSLLAAALSVTASLVSAQVPAGGEFQVNVSTIGDQRFASAAIGPSGDFLVVWQSDPTPADRLVMGRRYDARGVAVGSEFPISSGTARHEFPNLDVDASGKLVVVWSSTYVAPITRARRYDVTGRAIGAEFQVLPATAGWSDSVALQPDGGFVVVSHTNSFANDTDGAVVARLVAPDNSPRGPAFLVNTYTTRPQDRARVDVDGAGRFVVVWRSYAQDGSHYGVFAQRFDAAGARLGGEFQVNTYTTSSQEYGRVGAAPDGRFVVVWSGFQPGTLEGDVFAQRYEADGTRIGGEFRVNQFTLQNQAPTAVAMAGEGQFVVSWISSYQDGSSWGGFARRFDANAAPVGPEFRVNSYTLGSQWSYMTTDGVGNLLGLTLSYGQDGHRWGVFGQRFGGLLPRALRVDTPANGMLEPGETVDVRPSWRNDNGATQAFGGALSGFTGPPGLTYAITDNSSVYGSVANGATQECTDCYVVSVSDPPTRPQAHIDASVVERIQPDTHGQEKRWTLHVGESFADVPTTSGFYRFVETLLHRGVTGGCGPDVYCPASSTSREQMAVFVLVAKEGTDYLPPACTTPVFADVPASSPFCRWIEELARRGVVGGCGAGSYCPSDAVIREQMAVFVLRTFDPTLNPPFCVPPNQFADVPETSPFCRWIEELANRGIVTGCGGGNYCPAAFVTREQMGVFISVTFGLTLYGV